MRIVVPGGGTGQVGRLLQRTWVAQGHDVVVLGRGRPPAEPGARAVAWDARSGGDRAGEVGHPARADARPASRVGHAPRPARDPRHRGSRRRVLSSDPELLLTSRRVLPTRLVLSGFRFSHPTWPYAARDLVARARGRDEATGVVATLRATSAGTAG